MRDIIRDAVRQRVPEATLLRQRFHEIPERSFEEKKTAQLIAHELQTMGIPFEEGIARTGIVATIKGDLPGNIVVLRSDIDAIKVEEKTEKPYASKRKGYSHSCGHDGHIVCALEAARILSSLRNKLAGTVKVIFQPGEEVGKGAQAMIEEAALGTPLPSAIFALHSWPYLESGTVASKPGTITAINDLFDITIHGKGGHGARPHETNSPVLAAAHIVQNISNLTRSQETHDFPCVVSVGVVHTGTRSNVIPDQALIQGTIRSVNEILRKQTHDAFKKAVRDICIQENTEATIRFYGYCPSVENNPVLFQLFEEVADDLLIPEKRVNLTTQSMGSEDFGHFTQAIPGLLVRLGMGTSSAPLHTSNFDFCDNALESGIIILVGLAMSAAKKDLSVLQKCHDGPISKK